MHLTQQEVARAAGVSPSCLTRLESGQRFPSARILHKIATPLRFNEIELFTFAGYMAPQSSGMVETGVQPWKLDPVVAWALSQEPTEMQRAMLAILSALKQIASSSAQKNSKNDTKEMADMRPLNSVKV